MVLKTGITINSSGWLWAAAACLALAAGTGHAQGSNGISALKDHNIRQAIDISADRLEVRAKDSVAVFEGRVQAVQDDMTLYADRLTVHYQKRAGGQAVGGDRTPAISRIDALGKVKLTSPTESVAGDWGVYDMEQRIVTLGGAVVLSHDDVVVRGDRLQVDLRTGITKLETADAGTGSQDGRVRGRFVPADKESQGKN
jgi:lipopolysaccharide export system protein LptA